ncbi:phosphoenolpyruvate synthase [Nodularia sphaerocarpa]|uniref:phosphoenolpyruvate synthase n=3 Tax=Nodularia sphaerocarpa TaxID=137816 RepID=UPI001EFC1E94|nr:phosphoenolpyruvate synthase [Nodularia sphaerocarpa]MDB9375442.1 phosphoenolpyruvate synthase [Nodularia sphaerocarpa CS-585]ULP71997.1 Phosphoenolpyruvate synthase [Nodularia sphaerocarpa UHCC 0038]
MSNNQTPHIRWFETLKSEDVAIVGGKNASLGEMIASLKHKGLRVPDGFATTADAYWQFLTANQLTEKIQSHLEELQSGKTPLDKVGKSIRRLFLAAEFPADIAAAIKNAYHQLCQNYNNHEVDVAVRSSATAEDLPQASFAGQQETFLNITGEVELLDACRKCYASLFTDRAISYREAQGFEHTKVALSIGVQKMVRSDQASAGVMFSIDTETGFPDIVLIDAAWGLGENVVQGTVTPDEYRVFKPLLNTDNFQPVIEKTLGDKQKKLVYAKGGSESTKNINTSPAERQTFVLSDQEILQLAVWASVIETHYNQPMDMEWAKDGETGDLFIVQARPETVQRQKVAAALKTYSLQEKGEKILTGLSIGEAIASGKVCLIETADDIRDFQDGAILVTQMTDPDWVPVMKRAAGIVTDHGGRTCHAAIVSRELGIPAIVGTDKATEVLQDQQEITISCAEGDQGYIYRDILQFAETEVNVENIPHTKTQILLNIASPGAALRWWRLPCDGIGLARMEFIINNIIKIHPMALVHFDDLQDRGTRKQIQNLTFGYQDKTEYFVDHLARGMAKIAAAQYPRPVIVRMSDFKTNEYANLIGGKQFELKEANPMLGFRGASRYYSDRYREGFALECRAIKRAREQIGFTNIIMMIPFCRTLQEADQVLQVLAENGLKRGENKLQVYVMAEIPSNIELAAEFSQRFDGFSIGSNDLTQLVLGVDRDSSQLAYIFDESNAAVKGMIRRLIVAAHENQRKVGICGQAPSDNPEFAAFLVEAGIDSISLNPDSVIAVKRRVAEVESSR